VLITGLASTDFGTPTRPTENKTDASTKPKTEVLCLLDFGFTDLDTLVTVIVGSYGTCFSKA